MVGLRDRNEPSRLRPPAQNPSLLVQAAAAGVGSIRTAPPVRPRRGRRPSGRHRISVIWAIGLLLCATGSTRSRPPSGGMITSANWRSPRRCRCGPPRRAGSLSSLRAASGSSDLAADRLQRACGSIPRSRADEVRCRASGVDSSSSAALRPAAASALRSMAASSVVANSVVDWASMPYLRSDDLALPAHAQCPSRAVAAMWRQTVRRSCRSCGVRRRKSLDKSHGDRTIGPVAFWEESQCLA